MNCEIRNFNHIGLFHYHYKKAFLMIKPYCKKTASDENHRPCLPLKPQEKFNIFLIKKLKRG